MPQITSLLILGCLLALPPLPVSAETWVEETFEDFNDGTFDAAGQNLYATAQGRISPIHRFDLNGDGHQDLVFNSSHDFITAPPATLYVHPGGRAAGVASELPVRGSRVAAIGDMNKDGFLDLVVCPNHNWVTSRRYAFLFWGGEDGWVAQRMTNLITIDPRAVGVADLDNDGWDDLVILNGSRWAPEDGSGAVLRIYWGSDQAFRQQVYEDVQLDAASGMVVEDLDGDGRHDVAILIPGGTDSEASVALFWNHGEAKRALDNPVNVGLGTPSASRMLAADLDRDGVLDLLVAGGVKQSVGRDPTTGEETFEYAGVIHLAGQADRTWAAPMPIEAPKASSLAVADMDGDDRLDLLITQEGEDESSVKILPGTPGPGFDADRIVALPVARASAVAATDLDGDGNLDLVVGVRKEGPTYQSHARLFYGDGTGGFVAANTAIPTTSVNNIVVAPNDNSPGQRLIFCNNIWGRVNEDIPVYVYYGGATGFDPMRLEKFRIRSGYCSNAADLNDDGHVDLIIASIVHAVAGEHAEIGYNILWGDENGLDDDRRTIVPEYAMTAGNVGDLDRDGYLDLVGSCNKALGDEPQRVVIWHGGPGGFTRERRVVLPAEGVTGPNVIADFNRDNHLDIAVACGNEHIVTFFWGAADGFDADRRSQLPLAHADDMSTADLNGDGWLDLVVTSYKVPGTLNYDFGTYLFWGSPQGFSPTNAQRLRTSSGCGISIADYDADGFLDIHVPNYKWTEIRESIQSFLFWGSPRGFSDRNRASLLIDSGHATQSADFNGDGLIDLAISCHSKDGDHFVDSRVYYNDGNRFASPRCQLLPTLGPHYMHRADVGNLYDRTYRQHYVSSVHTWKGPRAALALETKAQMPGTCRLAFEIRAAPDVGTLADLAWQPLLDKHRALAPGDRCLQYRATFFSDNGERYPVLDRVTIDLDPGV